MDNQEKTEIKFRKDMKKAGFEVWDYSGRFMYGRKCPAVTADDEEQLQEIIRATKITLKRDNLGLGTVLYTG